MGLPIYFGTVTEYIPQACEIFLVATLSMGLVSICYPMNRPYPKPQTLHRPINYVSLWIPITFSIVYSLSAIVYLFLVTDGSKISKINALIPQLHYNYLILQIFLIAFAFLIPKGSTMAKAWKINFACYLFYCLVVGERDFVFPIIALIVHNLAFKKITKKESLLYVAGFFGFMALSTIIFFIRDANQSTGSALEGLLNQGSILFINTQVIKMLNESYQFFGGYTYFNSILNLLPSWIYKTDFNTLAWFKQNYAAASDSGYGFALDAEGWMNFGLIGVSLTYIVMGISQRIAFNNFFAGPFFHYFSVFYTGFVMYSLRNDSLALLKGNLYAIIFYFIIHTTSKALDKIFARHRHSRISLQENT